jgi:hypothetical protein
LLANILARITEIVHRDDTKEKFTKLGWVYSLPHRPYTHKTPTTEQNTTAKVISSPENISHNTKVAHAYLG